MFNNAFFLLKTAFLKKPTIFIINIDAGDLYLCFQILFSSPICFCSLIHSL